IDLLSRLPLYDYETLFNELQPRVRPELNILVECKQSQLPYVFFDTGPQMHRHGDFPMISGLARDTIVVSSDDDASTWTEPIIHALGLSDHKFQSPPRVCHTLSKCVRKG